MIDFTVFKEDDMLSISMFLLYKLVDSPDYSILGELPYILDKTNLLNLCAYFGGRTIKVPTLQELNSVLKLLMLYQYNKVEKIPYSEALKKLDIKNDKKGIIDKAYSNICNTLDMFNFKSR